jgi:hypothetical protein
MVDADYPEKRVSPTDDRRGMLGGGGRRAEDHLASQFSTLVPCTECDVAWAALSSVAVESGQPVATYVCRRCQHVETRVGTA